MLRFQGLGFRGLGFGGLGFIGFGVLGLGLSNLAMTAGDDESGIDQKLVLLQRVLCAASSVLWHACGASWPIRYYFGGSLL